MSPSNPLLQGCQERTLVAEFARIREPIPPELLRVRLRAPTTLRVGSGHFGEKDLKTPSNSPFVRGRTCGPTLSPPPLRESEDTYEGLGLSVYRRGAGGG